MLNQIISQTICTVITIVAVKLYIEKHSVHPHHSNIKLVSMEVEGDQPTLRCWPWEAC